MRVIASACFALLAVAGCTQILGIGDAPRFFGDEENTGGQGGMPAVTSTGGAGGGNVGPCAQTDAECTMVDSNCVALVDNRDQDVFALRMSQVVVALPEAFKADTIEGQLVNDAFALNLQECRLNGTGTINLIVEIDRTNQQGRAGVAKYVADPRDGYDFVDEIIQGKPVAPVLFQGSLDAEGRFEAELGAITLPLFINQDGSEVILVPLREGRLFDVTLSEDQNCIGSYNQFGLDPNNGCLPEEDDGIFAFLNAGKAEGYVTLQEADEIVINAFNGFVNETLCARLANGMGNFVEGNNPKRCRRNAQDEILFPGDWCAATNAPWTPNCTDAVRFSFQFAGSAVKVNN